MSPARRRRTTSTTWPPSPPPSSTGSIPLRPWTPTSGACGVCWTSTARSPFAVWPSTPPARSTAIPRRRTSPRRRPTGGTWTARAPGPATMRRSGSGRLCATCSARSIRRPSASSGPSTTMAPVCGSTTRGFRRISPTRCDRTGISSCTRTAVPPVPSATSATLLPAT